jgi:hypothetical protein
MLVVIIRLWMIQPKFFNSKFGAEAGMMRRDFIPRRGSTAAITRGPTPSAVVPRHAAGERPPLDPLEETGHVTANFAVTAVTGPSREAILPGGYPQRFKVTHLSKYAEIG